ncbi:MAG: HupE/UreJ family protein [Deltaproteobacteria bacterium]|nr:HupE/UreJ family protein [Deltaproteobacteria bacterium]
MRRSRSWFRLPVGLGLLCLVCASAAGAHEVRPGYLEIRETDPGVYQLSWKVPAKGDRRLAMAVRLPEGCVEDQREARLAAGAHVTRWRATCTEGLVGARITIDGLETTRTDVLARVELLGGPEQVERLLPEAPSFIVRGESHWTEVARTYGALGIEHILLGFDHLLFVLGLLILVGGLRRLVATITAFTVAHSITLAAASLDWIHVAQTPVEACIALSIMFVGAEILRVHAGGGGLAARKPWLVAFGFGLLHGLGFAGALQEIGLPSGSIPLALAAFNVGVELGQLAFVGAALAVGALIGLGLARFRPALERGAAYAIGSLAAFWLIDRVVGFW